MKISWDEEALARFGDAMEYIAEDSYRIAIKISSDIENSLELSARYPYSHPPDQYRKDGNTAFRAFELHGFRISYIIEQDELVVIRFRHTKQRPLTY